MRSFPGWPAICGVAISALCACAIRGPLSIPAGSSIVAVTQQMGAPTAEHASVAGGKRLEYATGPYGKQTYMLDFDPAGRLVGAEQVLTELRFNAIRAGISRAELLAQIGRPSTTFSVRKKPQTIWAYRYDSPFCQWFMVGLDEDGRVGDTSYGPDPACEFRDRPRFR